jgi:membrane protein
MRRPPRGWAARLNPQPSTAMARIAPREIPGYLWRTINDFFEHRCPSMAAALSYYTFFSLPPLLLLIMLLLGVLVEPAELRGAVADQLRAVTGSAAAEQVEAVLAAIVDEDSRPPGLSILGAVTLFFGATVAFAELQSSLNRIWSVEPDPARGTVRNFLLKRVFSFGLVLVVAFLLLISLVLSAAFAALGTRAAAALPGDLTGHLLQGGEMIVAFALTTLLFGAMYRVIPDADVRWSDVWVGAVATALLFTLGKFAIGLYLGGTDPGGAYGAAGSLAVLLIWVYYTAMILFFGAELTRVWEVRYGAGVRPARGAVEVVTEKRRVPNG